VGVLAALGEEGGSGVAPDLGSALGVTGSVARQRALVAIVSDFRGPIDWRLALVDLAGRHDVLAVEVRDPREEQLVDIGEVWFSDPETGRRFRVDTRDARLRRRFADAAAAERRQVADALASAGANHVVVSTEGDWLRTLAATLRRRRR
jgi:uncharacterized protein (DUF58 family)